MRVAVTEGKRGLTATLSAFLSRRGHDVVTLTRRPADGQRRGDPVSGMIAGPGLADVDAVVNLYAPSSYRRWTPQARQEIERSRVNGTLTVVSALEPDGRCQRLLNLSSTAFYGDAGADVVTSDSPCGTGFLAAATAAWEASARHAPISTALLRTPNILTTSGGYLAARRRPLRPPIGSRRRFVPWIHRDDWLRAVDFLLRDGIEGPLDVTAPEPVREVTVVRELSRHGGARVGVPAPYWAIRASLGADAAAAHYADSVRAYPEVLLERGFDFLFPTFAAAVADLVSAEGSGGQPRGATGTAA